MTVNRNIKRLLQYRTCLLRFKNLGFEKAFSYNLGEEAGVSAEQVRKDFSLYGLKGNKKGGYDINELLVTINDIFKHDKTHEIILVGLGNIGQALLQYKNFTEINFNIVGAFDIDPSKVKKKYAVPVYAMEKLKIFVQANKIKIAILAVPPVAAKEVCNDLVSAGIKGILNFTPVVLKTPDDVVVNNLDLQNELEELIYKVDSKNEND